jgi:hypothetical protein
VTCGYYSPHLPYLSDSLVSWIQMWHELNPRSVPRRSSAAHRRVLTPPSWSRFCSYKVVPGTQRGRCSRSIRPPMRGGALQALLCTSVPRDLMTVTESVASVSHRSRCGRPVRRGSRACDRRRIVGCRGWEAPWPAEVTDRLCGVTSLAWVCSIASSIGTALRVALRRLQPRRSSRLYRLSRACSSAVATTSKSSARATTRTRYGGWPAAA